MIKHVIDTESTAWKNARTRENRGEGRCDNRGQVVSLIYLFSATKGVNVHTQGWQRQLRQRGGTT